MTHASPHLSPHASDDASGRPAFLEATRYVAPLREGGSLPAVVEADDGRLYVMKFSGAGQGRKALVAEWICAALARALDLPVPRFAVVDLDPVLAATEPDPEIQDLLKASGGANFALEYLPGAATYDPAADRVSAALASRIVWFDALVSNVDRTARNANLLTRGDGLWLIDHGAALYFHHDWDGGLARAVAPFPLIRDHILLPLVGEVAAVDAGMAAALSSDALVAALAGVPDAWLVGDGDGAPAARREAYVGYFLARLAAPRAFVEDILRARA